MTKESIFDQGSVTTIHCAMVDWLTPAELVLSAGGIVASWFVSKDSIIFVALQMGFALVVLAAIVSLFAYLPALVGYWRSRSQINRPS